MKSIKPSIEIMTTEDYESMIKRIELAGRTCYKSEENVKEDSAERFIMAIINKNHESVLEHANVTVRVICDRGVTHEIVRHRIASYSQESTRYCNYSNDKFGSKVTMIDIASGFKYDLENENDLKKYNVWMSAMGNAEKSYFEMLELGATPQEARSVLPNSLKTEIVMTMNVRSWRNFFKLRCSKDAHPQMREVAEMIFREFNAKYPIFVYGM